MAKKKCKKDFKKVGDVCVPTGKAVIKTTQKMPLIVYYIIIGALVSIGGWSVFNGFVGVTGIDAWSDWILMGFGFGILTVATVLGWRRIR